MNAPDDDLTNVQEEVLAKEAYERVEPELLAVPAVEVLPVGFDLTAGASTAIGSIPKLLTLKDDLTAELRKFDVRSIRRLEDYAYAVLYAHAVYQSATGFPKDLQELLQSGIKLRDILHADAVTLRARGLLPAESLREFDGLVGYMNVAADLQLLCTLMSNHWERIENRCATTQEELERGSRLAGRIVRVVGERERNTAKVADSADKRARAFTLFFNCYEEIRFAVSYVRRHEDDADAYAPSLHIARKKPGRSASSEKPAQPATPEQPATPAPQVNTPNPSATTPVNRNLDSLPGGSPYLS